MLRQPINFIYAAFAITLIGGAFTMYIAKASYQNFTGMYTIQYEFTEVNDSKNLN